MGGFFGFFDYSKPGPGVEKDAPKKAAILVFFDVLSRKFWHLIKVNLMFSLFNIPALVIGLVLCNILLPQLTTETNGNSQFALLFNAAIRFGSTAFLICIPFITVGPAQAGFTYILRNYAREEHAFIWSDFKENAKKNFKESMTICIIDLVILTFMLFSIKAYMVISKGSIVMLAGSVFMILSFIFFAMMHLYIYPLLVTFKLSVKQVYKNALLFSAAKFLPNLIILIVCALIIAFTFGLIIPFNPAIGLILYFFITLSLIGLITNSYAYPKLKKYMLDKIETPAE